MDEDKDVDEDEDKDEDEDVVMKGISDTMELMVVIIQIPEKENLMELLEVE